MRLPVELRNNSICVRNCGVTTSRQAVLVLGRGTGQRADETSEIRSFRAGHHMQPAGRAAAGRHLYRYEWFRVTGRPGESDRVGLVLRDTTDESRMQEKLVEAEKSGSLGILTAGIGHELNNPLFGILGLGEALQDDCDPARVKSYAQDIVQHGKRMATIIRDFTGIAAREISDQRQMVHLEREMDDALAAIIGRGGHLGIDGRAKLRGGYGGARPSPINFSRPS